jgi:hypothetical protein
MLAIELHRESFILAFRKGRIKIGPVSSHFKLRDE